MRLFLEAHAGHDVVSEPDLYAKFKRARADKVPAAKRAKKGRVKTARYSRGGWEITCRECEDEKFESVSVGPHKNVGAIAVMERRIATFQKQVLDSQKYLKGATHPLLDPKQQLKALGRFLKRHELCRLSAGLNKKKTSSTPLAIQSAKAIKSRKLPVERPEVFGAPPESAEGVLEQLSKSDVTQKLQAIDALSKLAEIDTLPSLLQTCVHRDPSVRAAAVRAVSRFADTRTAPTFRTLARFDPDASVRGAAVRALAELPSDVSLRTLGAALFDDSPDVRESAVGALERSGTPLEKARELAATFDPTPGVYERWASIDWTKKLEYAKRPSVIAAAADANEELRDAAFSELDASMGSRRRERPVVRTIGSGSVGARYGDRPVQGCGRRVATRARVSSAPHCAPRRQRRCSVRRSARVPRSFRASPRASRDR